MIMRISVKSENESSIVLLLLRRIYMLVFLATFNFRG